MGTGRLIGRSFWGFACSDGGRVGGGDRERGFLALGGTGVVGSRWISDEGWVPTGCGKWFKLRGENAHFYSRNGRCRATSLHVFDGFPYAASWMRGDIRTSYT